ncbi:hypothetical protein MSAN_02148800 [Mycena sanguinolenta]|uniref:DRBM domain-containing protein n=1 Tax=Mycena sanguinolenta TaxID=230812 RepID=A0A8H6XFC5_9AGAR|nr:hypothetical protein MSAN_02148800 [Mycena sanguinolenta]
MNNIPALPKIEGDVDIILDIYSHRSLGGTNENNEYGNTDRLVQLGGAVLHMVLLTHLFCKQPLLNAEQIDVDARNALSDENLRTWFTFWNVKSKFRAAPGACDILESPEEMQRFFKSYVGALYIRNGIATVQAWIPALVDPGAAAPPPPNVSAFGAAPLGNPPPHINQFGAPPLPPGNPPPLPPHTPTSAPNILSLLNQTASQRGLSVTYPAEHLGGPPHAPSWRVTCNINGVKRGEGVGKNQKAAKEEAGRQAWQAMGW